MSAPLAPLSDLAQSYIVRVRAVVRAAALESAAEFKQWSDEMRRVISERMAKRGKR